MSELQNPLFDEEKEFLERKKLEYERALRGDVEHIKDQSAVLGKVALIGAGLAGGIWLIAKVFGGKKRKSRSQPAQSAHQEFDRDEDDSDSEFGADHFTAGNGKRYRSIRPEKSAADSANAFAQHFAETHEADDLGFGSTAAPRAAPAAYPAENAATEGDDFEEDPFQDLPYDDSRRLPASHAFDDGGTPAARFSSPLVSMIGSVLQSFLQSDTGKVLVAQVAAVAMAVVTKKVSEFFPAPKNADLATAPGYAPVETGFSPVATSAPLDSPDASTRP